VSTPGPSSSLLRSFGYAFAGVGHLLRSQRNARIHAGITLLVIAAGAWLRLPALQWALLALAMGLVWAAETVNTAMEALVDLSSPQAHPLARSVKDLAAGAVLFAAIAAAAVGALVFVPPLTERLAGD
jgi:diacylglycerol kinase